MSRSRTVTLTGFPSTRENILVDAFLPLPSMVFLGLRLGHLCNSADIQSLDGSYSCQTKSEFRVLVYLWFMLSARGQASGKLQFRHIIPVVLPPAPSIFR